MTSTFTPDSPMAAFERFLLEASQPEDVGIIRRVLFDDHGLSDPHHCGSRPLGHVPFTDAVCAHYGTDKANWHHAKIAFFGARAAEESPTVLLALLTAYDELAGTAHLGAHDNLSSDEQYLWIPDSDEEVDE